MRDGFFAVVVERPRICAMLQKHFNDGQPTVCARGMQGCTAAGSRIDLCSDFKEVLYYVQAAFSNGLSQRGKIQDRPSARVTLPRAPRLSLR
jgi:hypothetical protein